MKTMSELEAAERADAFIKLMLQHQANPWGWSPLADSATAKQAAQSLAAFRGELITQLAKQQ
jgi:hypothetical protein